MKRKKTELPTTGKNRLKTIYPFFVFCFSFLLYSQTINFKYTMFDDDSLLTANKEFFTKDGSIQKIFTTDAFMKNDKTFYRPLQNLSFLIDVKISGSMDARMFHITNVLLFSLIAFSLYFLLLKFNISHLYAFFGTLLYSAHPLFISSASWIPARGDLLLTLFSILSFIWGIRFLEKKKYSALIITWLCFTLALFSKETAMLLPVLFLIYFLTFNPKPKIDFKVIVLGFLLLCTATVWYFLRNLSITDSDLNLTVSNFLYNLLAIPVSLAMFAVPYNFSTVPEYTLTKILIGCVLLVLTVVLMVKNTSQPRKKKIFFLLWFLLLLIPTFFAKTKEWDYLDHRFLLPLIGILALTLLHIQSKSKRKVIPVLALITAVFSILTIFNSQAFSNPVTFYEAMKHNKNKPDTYYFLKGNVEQISGKLDNALQSYSAAIAHNPEHFRALNNSGIIKQTKGDLKGALTDYNSAIDLGLKNYSIFKNRGTVRMKLNDYDGAIQDFESALELEHQAEIYYLRGIIYLTLEQEENALEDFNRYFSENPVNPEIYTDIGIIFGKKGDIEKSINCFTKAIEADSTYTMAYYNRAFAEYISSDYTQALSDCNKSLAIDSLYQNAQILKKEVEKSIKENEIQ